MVISPSYKTPRSIREREDRRRSQVNEWDEARRIAAEQENSDTQEGDATSVDDSLLDDLLELFHHQDSAGEEA